MKRVRTVFAIGSKKTKPSDVRLRDVAFALQRLETAIVAVAKAKLPTLSEDELIISLPEIVLGSDGLVIEFPETLVQGVAELASNLAARAYSALPRRAHSAVWELDQRLTPRYGEWGFDANSELGVRHSRANAATPVAKPNPPKLIESQVTLYGWLYEAGGKNNPELTLSVDGKKMVVELSQDLARQAGARLYTTVGLEGVALWDPVTLEIQRVRAVRILEYREDGLMAGLERVATVAGKHLSRLNLVEHFGSERTDKDPE